MTRDLRAVTREEWEAVHLVGPVLSLRLVTFLAARDKAELGDLLAVRGVGLRVLAEIKKVMA